MNKRQRKKYVKRIIGKKSKTTKKQRNAIQTLADYCKDSIGDSMSMTIETYIVVPKSLKDEAIKLLNIP